MATTSKKQVENKFKFFIEAIGGKVASSYNDVGGYRLDYASCYGGYNIEQISNDSGAVSHPFGCARKKAGEFWDTLDFAGRASEAVRGHHGE